MRTISLSFFLGTLVVLIMPELPALIWIWLLLGTSVASAVASYRWRHRLSRYWLLLVLAGVLAGSGYALLTAKQIKAHWLPTAWEGEDILLTGTIVDIPEQQADGWHFVFQADSDNFQGKLRLGWYSKDAPVLQAGERWQFLTRNKRPNGFSNPNGFDYEQWLFTQRIGGTGYVRESPSNQRLSVAPWWNIDHLRQWFKTQIDQALVGSAQTGLIQGLAIAYTGGISQAQWDTLRKTGTIHLLAISGLHITMVAGLGIIPVWLLWNALPRLYLLLPLRLAAGMTGGVLAIGYSLLAGMNIPTQRTLIMLLVMLASLLWRRQLPFSITLSVALLLVTLLDPLAALSVGFWLSFLTVGLLVLLGSRQRKLGKSAVVWMQLLLSIGTIPLTAGFFGMLSLNAPLANLVAIPLVTFVITPLVLLGMVVTAWWPSIAGLIWSGAAHLLAWLLQMLEGLANFSLSTLYMPLIPLGWLIIGLGGFLILILPRGMPGRWLGLLWLLPMIFYKPSPPAMGEFRVNILDVGQGLASVVQTAQHTLVFDTGPKNSESFDTGEMVVVPWLRGQGISQVDTLMISHADMDHTGGAAAVLSAMTVQNILTGAGVEISAQNPQRCQQGQIWEWDGVTFTVLHPAPDYADLKDNNQSCVLRIANSYHSILFTADIERPVENTLVNQTNLLETEVLLVPHHGSKTSSSPAFIDQVKPHLAIVTSGYRNRYHHPHPEISALYHQRLIEVLDTAASGEITIDFPASKQPFFTQAWRLKNKHIWGR